jgi:hypothetical protein
VLPVTIPLEDPTNALPLLLLQVPPAGVAFNVEVKPIHTEAVPVIAEGLGFTVIVISEKQPVDKA